LRVCDKVVGTSDPYAKVCASSEDGAMSFQQNTAVVARNLNPNWNECFEFPLAPEGSNYLEQWLDSVVPGVGSGGAFTEIFPLCSAIEVDCKRAMKLWADHLTTVASRTPAALGMISGHELAADHFTAVAPSTPAALTIGGA